MTKAVPGDEVLDELSSGTIKIVWPDFADPDTLFV
jgi:hypothetical protein